MGTVLICAAYPHVKSCAAHSTLMPGCLHESWPRVCWDQSQSFRQTSLPCLEIKNLKEFNYLRERSDRQQRGSAVSQWFFFSFLMWIFLHSKMETWIRVRKTSIEHAQMCLSFVWRFNTQTRFPQFSGTDKCAASVFKHWELLQHMEKESNLSYTSKQQPSFKVPCLVVILLLWLLSMKEEGIEKVTQISIILKYTKSLMQ